MMQPTHLKQKTIQVDYLGVPLTFCSDFDSGNLWRAEFNKETNEISLQAGRDRENNPSIKNWFYFSVKGHYEQLQLKLVIEKCSILQPVSLVTKSKVFDAYRPVIRQQGQKWQRLPSPVEFETVDSILRMKFNLGLTNSKGCEIALIYPWTVTQNEAFLRSIVSQGSSHKDIYINKEVVTYSYQKRPIHLLSISSADSAENRTEDYIDGLFPQRDTESHYKYSDKPIIMIIARVHPGEVGASHSCNGMLKFLVSNHQIVNKLRKEFFFWVIPMLNPDGVHNGNNRMDILGQNLNRFYHLPDKERQPSCFAVKSLVQGCRKQLYAFFDLHGHANRKSCFLYGNSIALSRLQAESLLFAKILSLQCQELDFSSCNFSKKQMSTKDKSDQLTKEGCARVVVHRWSGSPYCYTLETGLHKNIRVDDKGIERFSEEFYTIQTYENLGRQMLLALHQTLSKSKKIDQLRKQMVTYAAKLEKSAARVSKSQKQLSKLPPPPKQGSKQSPQPASNQNLTNALEQPQTKPSHSSSLQPEKAAKTVTHSSSLQCHKHKQIQDVVRKNKQYLIALDDQEDTVD